MTATERALVNAVALRVQWGDCRDAIQAEPIPPLNWQLGIHRMPCPVLAHSPWGVSDLVTGRLVAIETSRELAISGAIKRLARAACAERLSIPEFLNRARQRIACGSRA
ncbi:hypothetical protein [Imhoffiella purpurea]|uniref:Uncharacterized protein n=1 Tax=Imhoffiella purpurea TaxID=1249627 RepID=W9VBJ0_9GAMM|nr:hypothetical protein [Imhoffiella purpurea]EXJ16948.1 hypothetical protein D779_1771 [Imhoffiella purpurea]